MWAVQSFALMLPGIRGRSDTMPMIALMLFTWLSWFPPHPVVAADGGDRRTAMADAMLNMMDAMGFGGTDQTAIGKNRSLGQSWAPFVSPAQGSRWGVFGTRPWAGTARDMLEYWSRRPWAPSLSALAGVWLSASGERLTIRGHQFRLEAGPGRASTGILQLRGRLLALQQPRSERTWIYEYAVHEGRLVLRDAQGQLFLYRRVPVRSHH